MLGHSTVSMTLDIYSHVIPDMQKGATAALDRLLEGHQGHTGSAGSGSDGGDGEEDDQLERKQPHWASVGV